jgi:hypothetical protein
MDESLEQGMERADLVVVGAGTYDISQPSQHCMAQILHVANYNGKQPGCNSYQLIS